MIPKIIHLIWFSRPSRTMESFPSPALWQQLNPDWEIKWWTYENLPCLINQKQFNFCRENPRMQSDISRIELLYHYGGMYVDMDVIPLRPLSMLELPEADFIGFYENRKRHPGIIANTVIFSTPENKFLGEIIKAFDLLKKPKPRTFVPAYTGPQYISKVLADAGLTPIILDEVLFYPEWCNTKNRTPTAEQYPNSIGFHLWSHSNKLKEYGW